MRPAAAVAFHDLAPKLIISAMPVLDGLSRPQSGFLAASSRRARLRSIRGDLRDAGILIRRAPKSDSGTASGEIAKLDRPRRALASSAAARATR